MRVADQALPSDHSARFLEVGAHHDEEVLAGGIGNLLEAFGVGQRRFWVVNRTGADHDHETTLVLSVQHGRDSLAARAHRLTDVLGRGHFFFELLRRDERSEFGDA